MPTLDFRKKNTVKSFKKVDNGKPMFKGLLKPISPNDNKNIVVNIN